MKYSGDQLDDLLATVHREEALPGEHPSTFDLAAHAAGEATPGKSNRLQEHLSHCRECSELVLDFAAFREDVEGAASASFPSFQRSTSHWVPWALAAALFVAVGALAAWNLSLQKSLTSLRAVPNTIQAHAGIPVILRPRASERSGGRQIVVGQAASLVFVLLPRASLELHQGPYELHLLDQAGTSLWSEETYPDLEDESGAFGFSLLLEYFPPGRYRLCLAEPDAVPSASCLEEFNFELIDTDDPDK